jgi:hypothetical protein
LQAQHWQPQPEASCCSSKADNSSSISGRPALQLTIDSAEQLPAAEAVIASMYGVLDALNTTGAAAGGACSGHRRHAGCRGSC